MCARKIMSSHFLYNFRPKDLKDPWEYKEKGEAKWLDDRGFPHCQSGFRSVAFYGHKNFIIIFNNLGKHIAASEASTEHGALRAQSTEHSVRRSTELSKVSPPYHLAHTHAGHFRLYMCRRTYTHTHTQMEKRTDKDGHEHGHGYGQWEHSRSQSANAVNHGAGKQATERKSPQPREKNRLNGTFAYPKKQKTPKKTHTK